MNYLKEVTKDLIYYLVDGQMHGETVDWFVGDVYPSDYINNTSFKFITKWEDAESLSDDIIPVLIVTLPDKWKDGEVMKDGQLTDIKSLLVTENNDDKIGFFVVVHEGMTTGNIKGNMQVFINIDYDTDKDMYGFIAKEISTLIKMMYWKPRSGDYHWLENDNTKKLFFVPSSIEYIADRSSILGRIKHTIDIKACNFS